MSHHNVLLIEDDPDTIKLLSILFKMEKIDTKLPEDLSEEAILAELKDHHYRNLVIDVNISQVNGIDVVRRIRKELRAYRPFILMFSGLDMNERCLNAGADVFFQKPYDPSKLIHAIKSHETPEFTDRTISSAS